MRCWARAAGQARVGFKCLSELWFGAERRTNFYSSRTDFRGYGNFEGILTGPQVL
ncbi:hypothetical protein Desti_0608 [Desulfomonile tiedjei DSM 6799]|uniref:Uncharacterized protein n=1 Tax=Desulfomonile tiedjei (strain ATCC 49306 / DSM 6799 / DCB-1) TaxID=706587 RepID=I4C195_DESTA|nr:hypothetical protein Desti_0608 [Desulfomonile tiedjei DSM 6799]